jgi:fused signal recognition particle receptor
MAELSKINKSIGKGLPNAPHETWIVVDATTGQNAVQQVKAFSEVTNVSGIVVTKLDGTAKGGVIIGIADQFKIPIRYIGVGEKAADLRAFEGADFMRGLLGT